MQAIATQSKPDEFPDTVTDDFTVFARASLRVVSHLLDEIPPQGQRVVEEALKGGAILSLEFGPVPEFSHATLVMTEREGQRHKLTSISVQMGPPTQ